MTTSNGTHSGKWTSFPALFMENANKYGNSRASMREKDLGIWQTYSWADAAQQVRDFANGLAALGFKADDRLCIVGDNRPELYWGMLAAQCLGGVPVPLYQDSIEREMQFIVEHSEARFALVEDQEQADKMIGIKADCPRLEYVIYKDQRGMRGYQEDYLTTFKAVQEAGREFAKSHPHHVDEAIARLSADDLAVICYTSGTTGQPKGVMLTHAAFHLSSVGLKTLESMADDEAILAYLPMAWAGDQFLSFGMAIIGGYTVHCPESAATVLQDLREVGPTTFFAPPRIWENLLTSVMIRMDDAGWVKRTLFQHFVAFADRLQKKRNAGGAPNLVEALRYFLGKLLIYGPLLDNLGLGRVRLAYTAGEAIGPEIYDFFRGLGINLKQIYALTEAGIFVTIPENGRINPESSGPPVPWVEIKISDSGEVLVKGEALFKGYLKNPEATAAAFEGDYFKTGDAGIIDHVGELRIIDRAKDVTHLLDGTMFAPKYIENKLKFSPFIKEAVAIGQDRPYVTVMINIDAESVGNWCERRNLAYSSYTDLAQNPAVHELVTKEVLRVNGSLAAEEALRGAQIRRYLILHKELDPDDEEITRTRKVRRGFVSEKYKVLIEALYSNASHVETEAKVRFEDGREATIKADLEIRDVGPPQTSAGAAA